jgi:hypothetical protein
LAILADANFIMASQPSQLVQKSSHSATHIFVTARRNQWRAETGDRAMTLDDVESGPATIDDAVDGEVAKRLDPKAPKSFFSLCRRGGREKHARW